MTSYSNFAHPVNNRNNQNSGNNNTTTTNNNDNNNNNNDDDDYNNNAVPRQVLKVSPSQLFIFQALGFKQIRVAVNWSDALVGRQQRHLRLTL